MNCKKLLARIFGLALLASFGCGTLPIPTVAVAGTTITIPIPSAFNPGFGRVMNEALKGKPYNEPRPVGTAVQYVAGSRLEDEQLGEMLFALHSVNDPVAGFVGYLRVRHMVRVHMDEGSRAANPAPGETAQSSGSDWTAGQALALVDIPGDLPIEGATDYWIFPERWKRNESDPDQFLQDQPTTNSGGTTWRGWGTSDPGSGIPITIVPAVAGDHFNPFKGWDNWFTGEGNYLSSNSLADDLSDLTPRPKVTLLVLDIDALVFPAAFEVEIGYPREVVEILGMELVRAGKSEAVIAWQPDTGELGDCTSPTQGSFRISMVDPEQKTLGARIIYRLRDFASCGRTGPGEFVPNTASLKAYDMDGSPMETVSAILDESSFR
jgi:hypothetical protein